MTVSMTAKALLRASLAALILAGCVPTDRPPPSAQIPQIENLKRDVAGQRNRGMISYEEAARRQFEIERAYYSLNAKQLKTWRLAIDLAHQYDYRQITRQDYERRKQMLFADYTVPTR